MWWWWWWHVRAVPLTAARKSNPTNSSSNRRPERDFFFFTREERWTYNTYSLHFKRGKLFWINGRVDINGDYIESVFFFFLRLVILVLRIRENHVTVRWNARCSRVLFVVLVIRQRIGVSRIRQTIEFVVVLASRRIAFLLSHQWLEPNMPICVSSGTRVGCVNDQFSMRWERAVVGVVWSESAGWSLREIIEILYFRRDNGGNTYTREVRVGRRRSRWISNV